MRVNTDIYPLTRYEDGGFFVCSRAPQITPANGFPLGQQINKSITFSASVASFAPMRHVTLSCNAIAGMSYKVKGKTGFEHVRRQAQQIIIDGSIAYNAGENFTSLIHAYNRRYEPGQSESAPLYPVGAINYRHLMSSLIVVVAEITPLSTVNGHYYIPEFATNNKIYMSWDQYKTSCADPAYILTHAITNIFLGNVAIYKGSNNAGFFQMAFCDLEQLPLAYFGTSGETVAVYGEGNYYYYTPIYQGSGYVKNAGTPYSNSGRLHFDHGNDNLPVFNTTYSNASRASSDCDMIASTFSNGGTWIFGVDPDDDFVDFIVYGNDYVTQGGPCEYCINPLRVIATGHNYIETLQDWIYKRASTYGVPFCTSNRDLTTIDYDHLEDYDDLVIPQITDDGVFDGDYTEGGDSIEGTKAADFYDDPDGNTIYVDGVPEQLPRIDPNEYTDTIQMGRPAINATGIFNPIFALNQNEVKTFRDYIYNANDSIWDEILDGLKLMGANPMDAVISLRLYPFDVSAKMTTPQQANIVLGRTELPITGYVVDNSCNAVIDMGRCSLYPINENFLDYSPYTEAELYVPFIGKFPIDTEIFMGHDIIVKMIVDYTTGAAVCVVYCDSIPVIYKQGSIAVEIPITGTASAQYANGIVNSILGTVTGATSGAASGATKGAAAGPVGAIAGAIAGAAGSVISGGMELMSNLHHVNLQSAGTSTPQCALYQPLKPYLTIYRPQPDEPRYYADQIGYACNLSGDLAAFSGFVVCANVKTDGLSCTDAEREMILNYLTTGVYN